MTPVFYRASLPEPSSLRLRRSTADPIRTHRWAGGHPRFTRDVDILLEVPQIVLPGLLDDLVERGFAIDPGVVIKDFVREHVASFPLGRVRIDRLKPVLPLYSRTLADASPLEWTEGHTVRIATAEGLILTKMVPSGPGTRWTSRPS